jgi:ABC-type sugar transport system ATPase subunit
MPAGEPALVGEGDALPHTPAIATRELSKRYGGVVALDGVGFEAAAGSIHAVVGENGAGKSTLMKVLAGAVQPDAGEVVVGGEVVHGHTPQSARARGIGIVYQELSLFPNRPVLANLFANREPTSRGLVATRRMREQALPAMAEIGLDVDLDGPVGSLPIGEQQLVELCRVLLLKPRVLILDEPNSALSERETQRLFTVLRRLAVSGIAILYVSHRLEEVFSIADTITVIRNGHVVLSDSRASLTLPAVVHAMIGRSEEELYPERGRRSDDVRRLTLSVRNVTVRGRLHDVSFEARSGDIVGLAGIEGSGVTDLLGVLFGVRGADGGEVTFPDGKGLPRSATAAARRGISLVPADRRRQGLMLGTSIARNVVHVKAGALAGRSPWLRRAELTEAARRQIDDLQIKTPSAWTLVHQLSGGNQQKVVLGKWLEIGPDIVFLDDPARGVDIGAKREIFKLIRRVAGEGRIVLFRSTELPELIGLCDRILVFYRGRVTGELDAGSCDQRTLLHAIHTGERPREEAV